MSKRGIIEEAVNEWREEKFRAAVGKEKEKLRAKDTRSWWRRLVDLLPLEIVWRK